MLISKVTEEESGERRAGGSRGEHRNLEYQTANELFELMTKNANYECDTESLSTQDLVLLYQNIEIGTKLINDASELTPKKPNQHIETVVYNDQDDHGSDSDNEMYTNADMHDVFMVNQEQLDFLTDKSLVNHLSHKLGGVSIHPSDLSFNYDKKFLFKDPYIKSQLQNLNVISSTSDLDNIFSTSLIDYICCKRLEDNCNFYMDSVIRYVQNTIDQLKRISNGDYLTDRTKEKWREAYFDNAERENESKVLAKSPSIPIHVERKFTGNSIWEDIVHSEVDVRSLSKILEKKIIVRIPKMICGTYRLYKQQRDDNLIISCRKEQQKTEKVEGSGVDVVIQLQRPQKGQVTSTISSIMILKTTPALPDLRAKEILDLSSIEETEDAVTTSRGTKDSANTVIEMIRYYEPAAKHGIERTIVEEIIEEDNEGSCVGTNGYPFSDRNASYPSVQYSSESSLAIKDSLEKQTFPSNEVGNSFNVISPRELQITLQKLSMQNVSVEESCDDTSQSTSKRRSPIRVRIKSPYENKSLAFEEKKRKRLLEIREKREKRKLALSETCKISKHKFGRVMPQASSSVTKLSITNKSFYNSIYGHNPTSEIKPKFRRPVNVSPESSLAADESQENYESPMLSPEKNSKKFINRNYYLDEAETEINIQSKKSDSKSSTTNSVVSNEYNVNIDILKQLVAASDTNYTCITNDVTSGFPEVSSLASKSSLPLAEFKNRIHIVPQDITEKASSGDACRKSIDQVYHLIKQLGKPSSDGDVGTPQNTVVTATETDVDDVVEDGFFIHGSESGTSAKHLSAGSTSIKVQLAGEPKVVISSKQSPKIEADKMKRQRNRRTVVSPPIKARLPENPLKAISQLLHEFDNVQKNRQQHPSETKTQKKVEFEAKDTKLRQGSYRRKSRFDHHLKDNDQDKKVPPQNISSRDKKIRPMTPFELVRTPQRPSHIEDKNIDKAPKKKVTDMTDEAKEARGEAVRGPSKFISRLNSLAQPKKSYVQAHREEYQNRYGRNMIPAERLQRLTSMTVPAPPVERNISSPTKNRWKKNGTERPSVTPVKQRAPSVPQLDQHKARSTWKRRSASTSPASTAHHSPVKHKHNLSLEPPDTISKKMGVTESYVDNHYRGPACCEERVTRGLRCRVPLVPHDFELVSLASSAEVEATSLGDKLHRMIQSVMGSRRIGLAALTECAESTRSDAPCSESDYCVDILEDNQLATAVNNVRVDSLAESLYKYPNSATDLENLETALYSHISGTFQKRLKPTPRPSMFQQMFFLQSGDAGSVLLKSVSSLKLNKRGTESFHELKTLPVLSNSHLDWTFAQIPMQIATVGYAFTRNQVQVGIGPKVQFPVVSAATTEVNLVHNARSSQCFRGIPHKTPIDTGAQVEEFSTEMVAISIDDLGDLATNSNVVAIDSMKNCSETDISTILAVKETECNNDSDDSAGKTIEDPDKGDKEEELKTSDESNDILPTLVRSSVPSLVAASDAAGYTTSLDMLVGLLNEIQKITCQNQITTDHDNCADLGLTYENCVHKVENASRDLVSIGSLDNHRQLESNANQFTHIVSNVDAASFKDLESKSVSVLELKGKVSKFNDLSMELRVSNYDSVIIKEHDVALRATKPSGVDKEVSVNLCEDCVDMCTNVPSSVIPFSKSCDFDVNWTASAVSVDSERSSQYFLSVNEYHTLYSNTLFESPTIKTIIELPQIEPNDRRALLSRHDADLNDKCFTSGFTTVCNIENVKKERSLIARSELSRYCAKKIDLDPMFKIKRDILVSIYSILVLTVFAALSFPGILVFQP